MASTTLGNSICQLRIVGAVEVEKFWKGIFAMEIIETVIAFHVTHWLWLAAWCTNACAEVLVMLTNYGKEKKRWQFDKKKANEKRAQ